MNILKDGWPINHKWNAKISNYEHYPFTLVDFCMLFLATEYNVHRDIYTWTPVTFSTFVHPHNNMGHNYINITRYFPCVTLKLPFDLIPNETKKKTFQLTSSPKTKELAPKSVIKKRDRQDDTKNQDKNIEDKINGKSQHLIYKPKKKSTQHKKGKKVPILDVTQPPFVLFSIPEAPPPDIINGRISHAKRELTSTSKQLFINNFFAPKKEPIIDTKRKTTETNTLYGKPETKKSKVDNLSTSFQKTTLTTVESNLTNKKDRSEGKDTFIVSIPLKQILINPEGLYSNNLKKLVINTNKLIARSYVFLRWYLLNLVSQKKDMDAANFPIVNEKFVSYFVTTVGQSWSKSGGKPKNIGLKQELNKLYKRHFAGPFGEKVDTTRYTNVINFISTEITTALNNNIWMHFNSRLRYLLNLTIPNQDEPKKRDSSSKWVEQKKKKKEYRMQKNRKKKDHDKKLMGDINLLNLKRQNFLKLRKERYDKAREVRKVENENLLIMKEEKKAESTKKRKIDPISNNDFKKLDIENASRSKLQPLPQIPEKKKSEEEKIEEKKEKGEKRKFHSALKNLILSSKTLEEMDFKGLFKKYENLGKLASKFEEYEKWAKEMRTNFLPPIIDECINYHSKTKTNIYTYYTIKICQKIESLNTLEKKIKIPQCFPVRSSWIPCYVRLDAQVIWKLIINGKKDLIINDNIKMIWGTVFNLNHSVFKKNTKGDTYVYTSIQTDGVGAYITFQKAKKKETIEPPKTIKVGDSKEKKKKIDTRRGGGKRKKKEKEEPVDKLLNSEKYKNRRLVAVDPGKLSLVMMWGKENENDEKGKKLRYTAPQRKIESLSKRNDRIRKEMKQSDRASDVQECENELSGYNSRTTTPEEFLKYIKVRWKIATIMEKYYEDILFRKLQQRTKIYRRKSTDRFLNKIGETYGKRDEFVLCYGNWSVNSQMKGLYPTIGKGLRREIEKKYDVVLIDEFRTSKLCNSCKEELFNARNKDGKKIHRLLMCNNIKCNLHMKHQKKIFDAQSKDEKKMLQDVTSNNDKCSRLTTEINSTIINRDVNACKNIFDIAFSLQKYNKRPDPFCRPNSTIQILVPAIPSTIK